MYVVLFIQGGSIMVSVKHFVFVLMAASALFADGFILFPPPYTTGLSVKYHKVNCTIDNGVATTVIDQEFVNTLQDALANGKYVFPVPKNAVITGFSVVVDGVAQTASVMSKTEARDFFTTAIKNSTLAALLEYTDNEAYSLEIGSIAPGTSRKVRISYTEVLPKTDGLSKYLYPLNTEKYSMSLIDTVSIIVTIRNSSPITSVFSPSYPVIVTRLGPSDVSASYVSARSRPDRDFDLYYKVSDSALSFHMFTYKQGTEDGYFLMLMTPQFNDNPASDQVIAKDMAFTIDRSGSMAGIKLQQAKDALTFCVNRLMPVDFFNIVVFDDAVSSNAQDLLPATGQNIPAALQYVQAISVGGNTDIAQALTTSLSRIKNSDRPHYLIFLTDGQPTAGVTDNNQISALVNQANVNTTRIFSVGFGYDVNTVLIDKISIDNNGYPLYCSPDQNIEEVISDLYKRIEAPILTSPTLSVISNDDAIKTYGISPAKLPDLFAGSEIAVYGRYAGQGPATISLSGTTSGVLDTFPFQANFPDTNTAYPFVPRLWATQHIARLMTRIKLQTLTQESLEPLIDSVKVLSLAYGIVTPYTSQLFVPASGGSWAGALQTSNGKSANDASNAMQGMQQNSNSAQTVVADTNAVAYTIAPQTNQIQNASNKVFIYASNSIWIDASFDSTKPADTIYYATDAYFSLAAQSPDLVDLLSVGNQTAFNYQGKNYLILDKNMTPTAIRGIFGPAKPALKSIEFNVMQKGGVLVFSGLSGGAGGSVIVYSAKGSVIAKIPTRASESTVQWNARKNSVIGLTTGAYVAVYKNNGVSHVKKFMILR